MRAWSIGETKKEGAWIGVKPRNADSLMRIRKRIFPEKWYRSGTIGGNENEFLTAQNQDRICDIS
jgi:hypothetical protein